MKSTSQPEMLFQTERKRAEEALRISEERYRTLFNTIDEGFCIVEMVFDGSGKPVDYRFLEVNAAFEKQTGLHGAEGKLMRELAPAHEAHWFEIYGKIALTGEPAHFVNEARALNRWYDVHAYRVGRPENRHVAIVFNDISEHKRLENELRKRQIELQSLFNHSNAGLVLFDAKPPYTVLAHNRYYQELFAEPFKTQGMVGKNIYEYAPAVEAQGVVAVFDQVVHSKKPVDLLDFPYDSHPPEKSWFNWHLSPVIHDGEVVALASMSINVTDRHVAEQALRESEAQRLAASYARNLIETSLDPLVTISADGKITDVNEATVKATGVPREGLIGTDFSGYFTEPEKASQGYRQVFDKGSVTDYPLTIRHKDGTVTDVLYNASVYRDEGGNVLGVFAAARDVTARKRVEGELAVYRRSLEDLVAARTAELQAANDELRGSRRAALNLLKDTLEARRIAEQAEEGLRQSAADLARSNKDLEQFAYVASHDLQEPLRAVGGFMGLLKKQYGEGLDAPAREFIDLSIEGAERMRTLINDLLVFSRVGTRGAAFKAVNMKEAVDGALKNLQAAIAESNTAIICETMPAVHADLSQMTQLMQNLIGNAIKFHGPRRPEVRISAEKRDKSWVFAVKDNGIGIEPQYFDRIFLIFQRLHTRSQYKGTGIGLAVCKKIVERHGGKIWVESTFGEGSTFFFTLPESEINV